MKSKIPPSGWSSSSAIDSISVLKDYMSYWNNKKENISYFVVKFNKNYCIRVIYNKLSFAYGQIVLSYDLSLRLVTKLLDNNIISPELSYEEYRIQKALGTVEIRKYKIDEQKLKELKDE